MNLTIGKRIQTLRKEKGMSQQDLANHLNMSRQAISKWELDQTLPDLEILIQISELFDTSIAYILGVEENEKSFSELYDLMQTVLNNQQKQNKSKNIVQIATISLCVISLILNLFMTIKLNNASAKNQVDTPQNTIISTMYEFTEDRFNTIDDNLYISKDSYLKVYYFELEKMVVRLTGKFYLNEYHPNTTAELTFKSPTELTFKSSTELIKVVPLTYSEDNIFTIDTEIPLLNYDEIHLTIKKADGTLNTLPLTQSVQHNYWNHAFLGHLNLTIPEDEKGNLKKDTLEFNPTLLNRHHDNLYWYYMNEEIIISLYDEVGNIIEEFPASLSDKTIHQLKKDLPTNQTIYVSFKYTEPYLGYFGHNFVSDMHTYHYVGYQPKLSFTIKDTKGSQMICQLPSGFDETNHTYLFNEASN